MMTDPRWPVSRPLIAVLSLGTTLGGWGLLARGQALQEVTPPDTVPTSPPQAQTFIAALPPIPTVAALVDYSKADGTVINLNLEPVPVIVEPGPRPQVIQSAPSNSSSSNQPVTSSGSSN